MKKRNFLRALSCILVFSVMFSSTVNGEEFTTDPAEESYYEDVYDESICDDDCDCNGITDGEGALCLIIVATDENVFVGEAEHLHGIDETEGDFFADGGDVATGAGEKLHGRMLYGGVFAFHSIHQQHKLAFVGEFFCRDNV